MLSSLIVLETGVYDQHVPLVVQDSFTSQANVTRGLALAVIDGMLTSNLSSAIA